MGPLVVVYVYVGTLSNKNIRKGSPLEIIE